MAGDQGRHFVRSAVAGTLALLWAASPAAGQAVFQDRRMPYDAFDALPRTRVEVPGGTLWVGFAEGQFALPQEAILAWVGRSARAVAGYYGRFPVASARVLIVPGAGRGVSQGQAWGHRGAAIRVVVGRDATAPALAGDWIMVHEMIHLALPRMPRRHDWLSEGLASYVEPIARAQAGGLSDAAVWSEFARNMDKGLPGPGDGGLDQTRSWGRIYWGGAMFCLIADIEIRKLTGNRLGLQHAMRGVLAAGGSHEAEWTIGQVLDAADAAIGADVLGRLHREHGERPVRPDLDALWRALGVRIDGDSMILDDGAPLAAIRRAITRPVDP